ncbi:MAG: hypothetical protein NW216_13365 [Hyphomicrobium sp.]|nr:hypothetical protein [Hyphomicrobium sp.]
MNFPLNAEHDMDDLPRTLRREKEAREREAREREAQAYGQSFGPAVAPPGMAPSMDDTYRAGPAEPAPAVVKAVQIPFLSLMGFFIKAVFAAIPALIILGVLLWGAGQALQAYFPELVKMKILISFPN